MGNSFGISNACWGTRFLWHQAVNDRHSRLLTDGPRLYVVEGDLGLHRQGELRLQHVGIPAPGIMDPNGVGTFIHRLTKDEKSWCDLGCAVQ